MKDLILNSKVIVCIGNGGVGKTTVSAALSIEAAKLGKKVLVLTIDPSQRLKTILGFSDGVSESKVKVDGVEIDAAILDSKSVFEQFLSRVSSNPDSIQKIKNNRLYQQLSTTLSGSQEFTAIERLYSAFESGHYDLIVLDTPPAQHAMDFLNAPQKLTALFNDGIAKWFRQSDKSSVSFFDKILATGTRQVLKALETLTGSVFMTELSDFFVQMQGVQVKLQDRINQTHRLLVSPSTKFVLVTSFDQAKLSESESISKEIRKSGYNLAGIIINRASPDWMDDQGQWKTKIPDLRGRLSQQIEDYYKKRQTNFNNFEIKMRENGIVLRLPESKKDISNLHDLVQLGSHLTARLPGSPNA